MRLFALIPDDISADQRRNYINVQIDAVGVGIAIAANIFIPVLLVRLGASDLEVGLLTSLQAFAGLLLSVPLGRMLERMENIVQWFSGARLIVFLSNILIGLAPVLLPAPSAVIAILSIGALVTVPNTLVNLCFTIIMNEVAGPEGRYELLSRRWALIQLGFAGAAALSGVMLSSLPFPSGYAIVFTILSAGAFISYTGSRRITIKSRLDTAYGRAEGFRNRTKALFSLVLEHRALLSFNWRRLLFLFGALSITPLLPLYYVRIAHASDSWIGSISTAQSLTLLIGYFGWTELRRRKGASFVLYATMVGSSLFPFLLATTTALPAILAFALVSGFFQAGVDLLIFDEMLKRIPAHAQAPLVSYSQSVFYLAAIVGPFFATSMSEHTGIITAILVCGAFRMLGALSFYSLAPAEALVAAADEFEGEIIQGGEIAQPALQYVNEEEESSK